LSVVANTRYRHRRWLTVNPHLFISQQTAATVSLLTPVFMDNFFIPLGLQASKIRQDRILDEAHYTADPVRLMRIFGISDTTALKYVHAAHPDRGSVIPR
jgi:hypothetical protein